jgi:hypothetical protein
VERREGGRGWQKKRGREMFKKHWRIEEESTAIIEGI